MSGDYIAHGVMLALAWFGAANVLLCLIVAAVARRRVADPRPWTPGSWLALRCLPAAASVFFVAAIFVPSYLRFEPRAAVEGFDLTLTLCAVGGLAVAIVASLRGARAWNRARRQSALWMRDARPLDGGAIGVPAYTIASAPTPRMVLAGIVSPRVFVSDSLIGVLTAEELRATLAHEASHVRSADNLKRLVIRLLPDMLAGTRIAAAIELRWATAAEHAADAAATVSDPAARCALASALVKVARLMPAPPVPFEPVSPLVGGGDLASRVESLLSDATIAAAPKRSRWPAVATLACAAIAYAPLLRAVHAVTEVLVNSLP